MKGSKYYYKGIPLLDYCKSHPELNYISITGYLRRHRDDSNLSDNEIIKNYIEREKEGNNKYYYNKTPLVEYCKNNNLNYANIINYIKKCKGSEENKGLSDDEITKIAIETYQPFEHKYLYNGESLYKYCNEHGIKYDSVRLYVSRNLKHNNGITIDKLIEDGIKIMSNYRHYYYNGIPLVEYCKNNGINPHSIRIAIVRKLSKCDAPLQQVVNECIESYRKLNIKYYYNGIPLTEYCKIVGLNYDTVQHKYIELYSDDKNTPVEEGIKKIVDYYLENPPIKTKYYFNEMSLRQFCDINGYPAFSIYNRIRTLKKYGNLVNNDELIKKAIERYEVKLHIDKINEVFNNLKTLKRDALSEIEDICEFLKINYDNVLELINMDFSVSQSINIIWYFYNETDSNNYKIITYDRLKTLFTLVNNIKTKKIKVTDCELYDYIGIYKSELYDCRIEILLRKNDYIRGTLFKLCNTYDIKVNKENFADFESEIKLYLITLIDRTNLNNYGQIVKYMDLTVKGYFRTFLKQYKRQQNSLSLDDAKYSNDRGTRREKSRMDYIADPINPFESLERSEFSDNMLKVLKCLSKEDLSFVILKYQENYSDNELAEYFNISTDEVREKNLEILNLLKNNDSIKIMQKL